MTAGKKTLAAAIFALATFGTATAQATPDKAPIHGLLTMGELTFIRTPSALPDNTFKEANVHPGIYAAVVILAKWSEVEPEPGKFDYSQIEDGLRNIRAYNAKYPKTPLVGKLRFFAGPSAPTWAKALDGGPVIIDEKGTAMPIGKFWSKPYRAAFLDLQAHLAAKYDTDPLLQEVAISSCSSSSAEPFLLPLTEKNVAPLQKAGYTDEVVKACLMGAIEDYATTWKHTAIDYTFNAYRELTADGQIVAHPEFTAQVMTAFRKRLGSRAVIANHGLAQVAPPRAIQLLADMQKVGPPIEFQTVNQQVDWPLTFNKAIEFKTTEFELWDTKDAGGNSKISYEQLKEWKAILAAQPQNR